MPKSGVNHITEYKGDVEHIGKPMREHPYYNMANRRSDFSYAPHMNSVGLSSFLEYWSKALEFAAKYYFCKFFDVTEV